MQWNDMEGLAGWIDGDMMDSMMDAGRMGMDRWNDHGSLSTPTTPTPPASTLCCQCVAHARMTLASMEWIDGYMDGGWIYGWTLMKMDMDR